MRAYEIHRLLENVAADGDAYLEMHCAELADARNPLSRTTLVYMKPGEFLQMAERGHDAQKTANVTSLVAQGLKFNSLPKLSFTHDGQGLAQVVGH